MRQGELLIRFRKTASASDQNSTIASIGGGDLVPLRGKSRVSRLLLNSSQKVDTVALGLRDNQFVEFAEPNFLIHQDSVATAEKSESPSMDDNLDAPGQPNDPRFSEQWALQNLGGAGLLQGSDIQITKVWKRSTGNAKLLVAVVDSGIEFSHPELRNQRWQNIREQDNRRDDDGDGFVDDFNGWDFVRDSNTISDQNGHGTNVAGIIAAEGNNNIGISGVLWQARLMSLRVLNNDGVGDIAKVIEALDYAADNGAQVINLSWGTDESSTFLRDAVRRASRNGAVVVCSAGNDGRDLLQAPYYPASFNLPNLISVSSSDGVDNPAVGSNFGNFVPTIAAPGVAILTTKANSLAQPDRTGDYELVSGTSAAAAIVTGVVGLFRSILPTFPPDQIRAALVAGARHSETLSGKNLAGGVVSSVGGMKATRPHGADEDEDSKKLGKQDNQNPRSFLSNGDSARNTSSNTEARRKRRRADAGPGTGNLNSQKAIRPRQPVERLPTPSKKSNCSPGLPNCDGRRAQAPPSWQTGSTAPVSLSSDRLLAANGTYHPSSPDLSELKIDQYAWLEALINSKPEGWRPDVCNELRESSARFLCSIGLVEHPSHNGLSDANALDPLPYPTGPSVYNYVREFFHGALGRYPTTTEQTFWENQLKDATALGSTSVLDSARYIGKAIFLSSEYSASTNTQYVTDLYEAYLQRTPDSSGLSWWTNEANNNGREAVRNAFAVSTEFIDLVASVDVGSYPTSGGNFSTSRIDILNRTGSGGSDLLSGNINFGIPILNLPGRSGLNLGLGLSYNSRVWSKVGSTIAYDTDRGFPGPGFRLGFPVIQNRFYSSQPGTASYLLITPAGSHMELRRVGSSSVYESADSSYTQLTDNGSSLVVRTTDGTQMTYSSVFGQWMCTQIKDRNGNYITVNYNSSGTISTIVDTLERTITFNYDGNSQLQTITQSWTVGGSSTTHTWATFSHDNITIDTNFSGLYMLWPQDGATMSVLTVVEFADNSHVDFEYNDFGQVDTVKRYASDDSLQSQTRYVFNTPSDDVPRVTDRYAWARYWNGDTNGAVASGEEARTQFTTGLSGGVMTTPDSTIYKEFFVDSTWKKGLTSSTEVWVGTTKEKETVNSWTQDNTTSISYFLNPRVDETNIYDSASHRRRTTITYTDYGLPDVVTEYESNASTIYRKTDTDYLLTSSYTNNRVIGLPSKIEIKDASNNPKSKD